MSSSDGDSILSQFLNIRDSVSVNNRTIPLVNVGTPLQWGKLGLSIAGSLIAAVVLGIQRGLDAVLSVPVTLFQAATSWVYEEQQIPHPLPGMPSGEYATGLIPTVRDGLLGVIDAAWTPFTGLGWLSFPVAVGTMLLSLYVVVLAVNYAPRRCV